MERPSGADAAAAARDDALRLLARRPRTVRELRDGLRARGHEARDIDRALAVVGAAGHLDDGRLALEYVLARSERLGHGRRRLIADLLRRGVARDVAEAAWAEAVEREGLDPRAPLRRQIGRRLAGQRSPDARAVRRVYNALLRAGFRAEEIADELAHQGFSCTDDDGIDHDFR